MKYPRAVLLASLWTPPDEGGCGSANAAPYTLLHNMCKSLIVSLHPAAVLLASMRALLDAGSGGANLPPMLHFNAEGAVDSSRCTAVSWVPGTQGGAFVAAYASGWLHIYHKVYPCILHILTAFAKIGMAPQVPHMGLSMPDYG